MFRLVLCALALLAAVPAHAATTYWNLFNIEEEGTQPAVYVTYATLADMLADTNRVTASVPGGFAQNVVGSGSDGTTYWSLFNIEGEATQPAVYVTYDSLADLLSDTNRVATSVPGSFAQNVVGSGSDGTTYWSLFNIEGEATQPAVYVTYSTLADMLADTNRVATSVPGSFAQNVVGSGSDGTIYWSLFNIEGEATQPAVHVTYATLADMLADTNRLAATVAGSFARNIVGSGAIPVIPGTSPVPVPAALPLLAGALAGLLAWRRRRPAG
ncbi:hypothetical protein HKCCE2091_17215 [Rhodobacterales bacterium HKCCE2091]|nr:hypothetical protein [Rhodobacterales bacterium HKCCE2091]